ncbi:MAG: hypothetical protein EZS28_017364 [Streblomastix strix]|uniref:Tyr recombinase domain-containing protein n=1 Tax=Streblomastix strix TaxID=222440 RepID=A0A5J4VWV1_9EUKA|nr:MAG: hypothetical protein EZS28_017364 [Streblomastix strix]
MVHRPAQDSQILTQQTIMYYVLKTMLQLIFDREPMHDTSSTLTQRAISNFNVVARKYAHVWDIDILFNHWAAQPIDQMLTNQDLQIKLASLVLSVCFLGITEISEVDLNLTNFNFGNHTALLIPTPQTTNALEQNKVRRIGIMNLCLKITHFTWLKRLREHFHQEITTVSSMFWTKQWKSMSIAKISEFLTLLIKKIGIEGLTAYSIKHASTIKLAEMGIQERDLNLFTNHATNSRSERNCYVFAANRQIIGIEARLVTIDHGLENQDSTSTSVSQQKKKNEAPNGDTYTLSPQGGDSMLAPFRTSFLPLSHLVFQPNPSSEQKVQTSDANTATNPIQTTPIVEWEEFRIKPTDQRDRAAGQQLQVQNSYTNNHSASFHDFSHEYPLRKPKPTPGQSQMIKDSPCLDVKNQRK